MLPSLWLPAPLAVMFIPSKPTQEALAVHFALLDLGWDNRTEYPIEIVGNLYRTDIWIDEAGLDVEIDGWQHGVEPWLQRDRDRDNLMNAAGISVLRFRNQEVRADLAGVIRKIVEFLLDQTNL